MLYIFDMDGTLIRSFMREGYRGAYDEIEVLPGRIEELAELRDAGHGLAIATNQGGVAFGYQTEEQVQRKLVGAMVALGQASIATYVCFSHPHAKVGGYRFESNRRKPGPGMIEEAMEQYGVSTGDTVFVGDMQTDEDAAHAAGVDYFDAEYFFSCSR